MGHVWTHLSRKQHGFFWILSWVYLRVHGTVGRDSNQTKKNMATNEPQSEGFGACNVQKNLPKIQPPPPPKKKKKMFLAGCTKKCVFMFCVFLCRASCVGKIPWLDPRRTKTVLAFPLPRLLCPGSWTKNVHGFGYHENNINDHEYTWKAKGMYSILFCNFRKSQFFPNA